MSTQQQSQSSEIELAERNEETVVEESGQPIRYQQLRPTDGRLHAWKVLIAAFFVEALLWGEFCSRLVPDYGLLTDETRLSHLLRCLSRVLLQSASV